MKAGVIAPPAVHFPLGLAMLCLSCEHVSQLTNTCPACGSHAIVNLKSWLR